MSSVTAARSLSQEDEKRCPRRRGRGCLALRKEQIGDARGTGESPRGSPFLRSGPDDRRTMAVVGKSTSSLACFPRGCRGRANAAPGTLGEFCVPDGHLRELRTRVAEPTARQVVCTTRELHSAYWSWRTLVVLIPNPLVPVVPRVIIHFTLPGWLQERPSAVASGAVEDDAPAGIETWWALMHCVGAADRRDLALAVSSGQVRLPRCRPVSLGEGYAGDERCTNSARKLFCSSRRSCGVGCPTTHRLDKPFIARDRP